MPPPPHTHTQLVGELRSQLRSSVWTCVAIALLMHSLVRLCQIELRQNLQVSCQAYLCVPKCLVAFGQTRNKQILPECGFGRGGGPLFFRQTGKVGTLGTLTGQMCGEWMRAGYFGWKMSPIRLDVFFQSPRTARFNFGSCFCRVGESNSVTPIRFEPPILDFREQ